MRVLQRKLFRDLNDLKGQVFTLAALVICGVSVLVSSWSAYQSLQSAQLSFYEKFSFPDIFSDFERAPSNILKRIKKISGVEIAEGRILENALVEIPNQTEPAIGYFVSWKKIAQLNKVYLRAGRFPESSSVPEVVVHESFAKAHHIRMGDVLTANFKGRKTRLQVAGVGLSPEFVYALSPVSLFPDDKHFGIFWIDYEILAQLAQKQDSINNIILRVSDNSNAGSIKLEIDQVLQPYGTLGSIDRSKHLSHLFLEDEIRQQKSSATIIPAIFLLVGAFILNVVTNRLIALHRSQISILKGLGYSSFELAIYYWKLISVVLLCGIIPAFILAHGIGQWYATLYERYFRFPEIHFTLTRESVFLGLITGFVPGWLSSLRALIQVFRLAPAEGMRPLSPPRFNRFILKYLPLIGVGGVQGRMIFRDLLFHPLRTTAAIVGISLAIGVTVSGTFWMDIMNFMMERQFVDMIREDVEVRFAMPLKKSVLTELKKIPGVYYVEGLRSIPVRLRSKNIERETSLLALPADSQLRRILDREGRVLHAPTSGVMLSSYFRKKYGFHEGEILTFEVIRGHQQNIKLPIAGFVDDVIGASVYVNEEELHQLLQEEKTYDSAFLKVNPADLERAYVKLKENPMVVGISVKNLLVKSFQETMATMITTFTLILIGFAVAISGSVIFNISRITFSEKGWELASLRILGLKIPEVFNILFAQLGIQVLIAAIPGLLLGYLFSFLSTYWIHSDTILFPLIVEPSTYGLAICVVFSTYILGGAYLFNKVQKLSLTDAMKSRE